jgi:hypothetical protein
MSQDKKDFEYPKLALSGFALLVDLLAQILNLIVATQKEVERIKTEENQDQEKESSEKKESGSPISVRAFKSSIILLQFSALETISNSLAGLAIKTMNGISGAPEIKNRLSLVEVDFLAEQRTYVETTTGSLKVSGSVFVSTLDKLAIAPLLFGKLHGHTFHLNKGGKGWQNVRHLKETRDKLTHFKLDGSWLELEESVQLSLDHVKPAVIIRTKSLSLNLTFSPTDDGAGKVKH